MQKRNSSHQKNYQGSMKLSKMTVPTSMLSICPCRPRSSAMVSKLNPVGSRRPVIGFPDLMDLVQHQTANFAF